MDMFFYMCTHTLQALKISNWMGIYLKDEQCHHEYIIVYTVLYLEYIPYSLYLLTMSIEH